MLLHAFRCVLASKFSLIKTALWGVSTGKTCKICLKLWMVLYGSADIFLRAWLKIWAKYTQKWGLDYVTHTCTQTHTACRLFTSFPLLLPIPVPAMLPLKANVCVCVKSICTVFLFPQCPPPHCILPPTVHKESNIPFSPTFVILTKNKSHPNRCEVASHCSFGLYFSLSTCTHLLPLDCLLWRNVCSTPLPSFKQLISSFHFILYWVV